MAQSFEQYAQMHTQPQQSVGVFETPDGNQTVLEVNFGVPSTTGAPLQMVWIKPKSMVTYSGGVHFQREGGEQGLCNRLKKSMKGDMSLTQATANGRAQLYLADEAKQITIFRLQGESISVNCKSLLAFEPTINHNIKTLRSESTSRYILYSPVYSMHLSGHGCVAVLTHGKAITRRVEPGMPPVFAHPFTTVAWSGDLVPEYKIDLQLKNISSRDDGSCFQIIFDGASGPPGFVLVQPSHERRDKMFV